jgi:hypothetical protein
MPLLMSTPEEPNMQKEKKEKRYTINTKKFNEPRM